MSDSFGVPTGTEGLVPEDTHLGICIGVIDLGSHMVSYENNPPKRTRKLKVQFELPGVELENRDGTIRTAIISTKYNLSFDPKATFRKTLDKWLGANWPTEHKGQSLEFLIGIPAFVAVDHKVDQKDALRAYAIVSDVTRPPRGTQLPKQGKESFYFSLQSHYLPADLSPWDAKEIRKSIEYQEALKTDKPFDDFAPKDDQQRTATPMAAQVADLAPAVTSEAATKATDANGEPGDDSIPF